MRFSVVSRDDTLVAQRADVDHVMALLPADATMLTVEAPQPLVLAHKRNLSRFQLFGNGLIDYLEATWPGGAARLRAVDRAEGAHGHHRRRTTGRRTGWTRPWAGLRPRGQLAASGRGTCNRDLGHATLKQARDVLHDRS